MKRSILLTLLLVTIFSFTSYAQVGQSAREWKGGSAPSGACTAGVPPVIYNGTTYYCTASTWTAESGGGGGGASLAKVTHTVCASGCDYTTLSAAVSGIGSSNEAILTIPESVAGFNGTVTKNIQLKFTQTGVLTVANGVVQNINNANIEAPEGKQIFSLTGTGRVTFGGVDNTAANQTQAQMTPSAGTLRGSILYASWWGVVADNSTDNATAIGKIQDIQPSSTTVIWPAGPIRHSNSMFMDNRFAFTWKGSGGHPKELNFTSGPTAFVYTGTNGAWQFTIAKCRNSLIEDIAFFGNRLAVLTDGADGGIYFTNSQGTSGDTDTANTLRNVTVFANAHRSGYVGIRMGEGGAGDAGSNSDHHMLEDVYVRADYYDNPVTYTVYGKALYLAHSNVKGINVLRGSLAQADTLIYSVTGNLSVKSAKFFFANRIIEASGGYDPITLDDIDSEYVANGGILGSGVFSLINSRLDRESTFNTLTAISGTPFFKLEEITYSINISNNKLGHWYHTSNPSTWGTSNYFFFGGTNAQYCKVKFNQNEFSEFDETKLRTNLMTVANAEYNQERLGHASSGYAQAAGTIAATTDALPVIVAAVQTNPGEQANAKTTCLAGALCLGGGAMQVSGPFDPNFLIIATKSGTHGGGVTRDFAIVAVDASGNKTKATYPTVVSDLNATLTGTNKVVLDWPDVTGASSYDVLERNQADATQYRLVANVASSAYDVVANPSGAYSYTRPSYNEALYATLRGQYINVGGTSAVTPLRFLEASANGTNYVSIAAPSSISSNIALTLPSTAAGTIAVTTGTLTSGNCVKFDSSGRLVDHGAVCGGGGSAGGSDTQVQRNNAGAFGGISGFTSDGTNVTAGSGNLRATSPRITTDISDTNGNEVFKITATGSAVNEFTIANAATGNNPTITASGGDTNVGLNLVPKGSGTIQVSGDPIVTLTATQAMSGKQLIAPKFANGDYIADANGNEQIKFATTASAVNEITVTNAATGSAPTITATGGDTNISLSLTGKGSGQVYVNGDIAVAQNTAPPFSSVTTGTITGPTTISVKSTTSSSATFDSGTTGAVNLGTGANAKTVTLGSSTSTSTTNIRAGSGNVHITAGNFILDAGLLLRQTGSTSGTVDFAAAATTTSYSLVWPSAQASGVQYLQNDGSGNLSWATPGGGGTVTSVAQSFTGGLISVSGSPITSSGTLALTVAGTSGGIPYFSSSSTWASSAALAANALVIGGGAGAAPSTTTTGTGILTWLGTPSSANLASALTDETGSGATVFGTSPTIATLTHTGKLTINGATINTDADGTVATLASNATFTKNDSNTRTFAVHQIKPTLNTGASNANTTIDILQIDTTNTATTGLTVNLIDAMYGGSSVFTVNSAGSLTAGGVPVGRLTGLGTGVATALAIAANGSGGFVTDTGTVTLTNKTISGASNTLSNIALTSLTSDTSTALGVGSLNIGHASDTTVSRVSAGVLAVEGVNVVTTSSTDTLTNKTLDAEATGNTITLPYNIEFIAAGMNGATGGAGLDLPASNAPEVAVQDGTNQDYGVLKFDATTDESAQGSFLLPTGWTGTIDLDIDWMSNTSGTNNVVWGLQTICAAAGEADAAWNTAQTVTDANNNTVLQRNVATLSSVTTTGCAAGERFHFKFYRDADNGSDTLAGDAFLKALIFTIRIAR